MIIPPVPGWAILAAGFYGGLILAALLWDWLRGRRSQRQRVAEERTWLESGADWLYESSVDEGLER
jgi:hypothetical protein